MKNFLFRVRWFFTGLRLFVPLVPQFVWIAFKEMIRSTIDYWKNSQNVVDQISDIYMCQVTGMKGSTTDYAPYVYWVCYSAASFLYLISWLVISWLTVETLRVLLAMIF